MSTRTYNPAVRVGNWIEDVQLEEDIIKDFEEKRGSGELLTQKNCNVSANFLKKESLTMERETRHLHFGDKVNVVHLQTGVLLSARIADTQNSSQLPNPCSLSASAISTPCPRNVFQICSPSGEVQKKPLGYGHKFLLKTLPGPGAELCVWSDRATFTECTPKSRQAVIQLRDDASFNVVWQILHKNPLLRIEMEGRPVLSSDLLIINHCRTNQNLACMSQFQHRTPYGKEMEVCCKTILDSHKAETEPNHWTFRMESQ